MLGWSAIQEDDVGDVSRVGKLPPSQIEPFRKERFPLDDLDLGHLSDIAFHPYFLPSERVVTLIRNIYEVESGIKSSSQRANPPPPSLFWEVGYIQGFILSQLILGDANLFQGSPTLTLLLLSRGSLPLAFSVDPATCNDGLHTFHLPCPQECLT